MANLLYIFLVSLISFFVVIVIFNNKFVFFGLIFLVKRTTRTECGKVKPINQFNGLLLPDAERDCYQKRRPFCVETEQLVLM